MIVNFKPNAKVIKLVSAAEGRDELGGGGLQTLYFPAKGPWRISNYHVCSERRRREDQNKAKEKRGKRDCGKQRLRRRV